MVIYLRVLRLPVSEHNLIIHTNNNYVNFILNYKKSNNRKLLYVYENNMSDVTKFTEQEMQEIAIVQSKYQQKIFELGQLQLEEIELDQTKTELTDRRSAILTEWKDIQKLEESLLNNLATKYGDGSLNLKDGTFKPAPKQQ